MYNKCVALSLMVSTFPLQALLPFFFLFSFHWFHFLFGHHCASLILLYLTAIPAHNPSLIIFFFSCNLYICPHSYVHDYLFYLFPLPNPTSLLCNFALSFPQPPQLLIPPSFPSSCIWAGITAVYPMYRRPFFLPLNFYRSSPRQLQE